VQSTMRSRLLSVTVAEVMDPNPVVIDGSLRLIEAKEQIFDPQDWPFVGVTDEDNHFLGVLTRERLEAEIAAGRPALSVSEVLGTDRMDWLIRTDQQLEDLLSHPTLATPGAVFAVDREDFLRGVVTAELVRRAITPAPGR
jgi:predicted transcriptional regulator